MNILTIYTLSKKKENVHNVSIQIIEPAFLIFGGIISDTTTKGNVNTPQQAINMVKEKLATGIQETFSKSHPLEFKYIYVPRHKRPMHVPIEEIVSRIFK